MPFLICTLPFTPLRDGPDDATEQHSQVLLGDRLELLAHAEAWVRVRVADGYRGFVRASHVAPVAADAPEPAHVVVVPQAAGRYLGTWLPHAAPGTQPLAEARASASGGAVVETARLLEGTRYEWGGMTREGIDCSGLVQVVHRRFGVLLPRDAIDQEAAGVEVERGAERAGDLLCFGDHIAIVAGPGTVVHASGAHGGVVEESLPSELARRIVRIRRVFAERLAVDDSVQSGSSPAQVD